MPEIQIEVPSPSHFKMILTAGKTTGWVKQYGWDSAVPEQDN